MIPDYISPIIGYRTWQWDSLGLKSLNDEPWVPGRALEARCRDFPLICDAPHKLCTCGIYAARNLEHLIDIGYMRGDLHGEVYLWGKVVEHSLGYRAQFAYPKSIVLPTEMMPLTLCEAESRLESLIAYDVDILIETDTPQDIPLWTKASGFSKAGFDWIRVREGSTSVRLNWRGEASEAFRVADQPAWTHVQRRGEIEDCA